MIPYPLKGIDLHKPGWSADRWGRPTMVVKDAKNFQTPEPFYDASTWVLRTSWGRKDAIWTQLDYMVNWAEMRVEDRQQSLDTTTEVLVTVFDREPISSTESAASENINNVCYHVQDTFGNLLCKCGRKLDWSPPGGKKDKLFPSKHLTCCQCFYRKMKKGRKLHEIEKMHYDQWSQEAQLSNDDMVRYDTVQEKYV